MKEVIIIGTSPLAITEAVFLNKNGSSVINIDDKSKPGGAWTTVDYKHLPRVEIGCHIWSYDNATYDFIGKFFEIDLVNLPFQPKIILKDRFIRYDLKSNLITAKKISKCIIKFDFTIFKDLKNHPELRLNLFPLKYKYPKTGAIEIEDAIHKVITNKNLDLKLNTTVKSIELFNNGGQLLLTNGETINFEKELVLTSLSQFEKITFEDGTTYTPISRGIEYIHRHLIIKGTLRKKFSYLRLMDHKLIHRISDMTSQVKDKLPNDTYLICVGIHQDAYYSTSDSEQELIILNTLKSLKLFNDDAEVVVSESNVYPSFYSDSNSYKEIEARSNFKIRFLSSTDFVYSFFHQLNRYSTLLD